MLKIEVRARSRIAASDRAAARDEKTKRGDAAILDRILRRMFLHHFPTGCGTVSCEMRSMRDKRRAGLEKLFSPNAGAPHRLAWKFASAE
ncbi:hypothetical protein [Pelagibacterium halotolerans]|uniref:hypothetical protein n=1 Tax=Pelagibacterium halotolerans TaxID=531813 RepID=UPI00384E9458